MNLYVLGYGSLLNVESVAKTLNKPIQKIDLKPVWLESYKRVWQLKDDVFSDELEKLITAMFLDISFCTKANLNGVVFEVSPVEFASLQIREKNYDSVDVTEHVKPFSNEIHLNNLPVYTFVGRSEHVLNFSDFIECYILQRYLDKISKGCEQLGSQFKKHYTLSTPPCPFPILDGAYRFVDKDQQSKV